MTCLLGKCNQRNDFRLRSGSPREHDSFQSVTISGSLCPRSVCFMVRWIKASTVQQMVLTAALGSMRRCCKTLASSQRPDTHRRSSSHSSWPRTLASAHTPPTAPTNTHHRPGKIEESLYGLVFKLTIIMKYVLDLLSLLLQFSCLHVLEKGAVIRESWLVNIRSLSELWPKTVTFDHQNLIRSSFSQSEHVCQSWRNSLKTLLSYHRHHMK